MVSSLYKPIGIGDHRQLTIDPRDTNKAALAYLFGPTHARNILDFGAVGDNVADDGPAFQSCIDELDALSGKDGGIIIVPSPPVAYRISTQVQSDMQGYSMISLSSSGDAVGAGLQGTAFHCDVDNDYAFIFGTDAIDRHNGVMLRGIHFHGFTGATAPKGVKVTNMNRAAFYNCGFRNLDQAMTITVGIAGGDNSWGVLQDALVRDCTNGIDFNSTFGWQIRGGQFANQTNYHIRLDPNSTLQTTGHVKIVGAFFDGGTTGPQLIIGGGYNAITHCKFEKWASGSNAIHFADGTQDNAKGNVAMFNEFDERGGGGGAYMLFDANSQDNIYGFNTLFSGVSPLIDNGINNRDAEVSETPADLRTATTAELVAIGDPINTGSKWAGKRVWNTTTNRAVYAHGSTAGSVWGDGFGVTLHTPA
ncbi:MAG: hypothetical protein V3S69_04900 [Dehalococcoidales bacterium]